jgi:hypothetical protein
MKTILYLHQKKAASLALSAVQSSANRCLPWMACCPVLAAGSQILPAVAVAPALMEAWGSPGLDSARKMLSEFYQIFCK